MERDCRKKAADQRRRQGNSNSSESAALAYAARKEIAKLKKNFKSFKKEAANMVAADEDQGTDFCFQTQDNEDWSLHWMCLYVFLMLTWGVLVYVIRELLTQRILPLEYLS